MAAWRKRLPVRFPSRLRLTSCRLGSGEWIDTISSLSFEDTVDVEVPRSLLKRLFGLEVMLEDLRLAFFNVSTLFSMRVLMTASRRSASKLAFRGTSMQRSSVDTALSVMVVTSRRGHFLVNIVWN